MRAAGGMGGWYGINASDRMLSTSTINFDVAAHELLPALMMGGRVVVRGPEMWSLDHLTSVLREKAITFSRIPTAYWKQWLDALPEDLPALRQVTVGGEGLPGDALKYWHETALGQQVRLDNLYGPTETTIASHRHVTSVTDGVYALAPIGQAYPSRSDVILDVSGGMVPVGGFGELCIGGETLARGYLGRASLTAERFVPDPWGEGTRLYRTGDLCRRRADGVIEFHGRIDQQIKLRGYRIEPGEIEAVLRAQAGVRDAVVLVSEHGPSASLVAYVTGEVADTAALKRQAGEHLPVWMVPDVVMVLDALPLLPNGKLDRRALPEPDAGETGVAYVAPRNESEAALLDVFRTVLGRDDIGVEDNFFSAGGDSLSALKVVHRLKLLHNIQINLLDIMRNSSVKEICISHISNSREHIRIMSDSSNSVAVFCLHPAFGLCFDFVDVFEGIRDIASVYFVESPIFYDKNTSFLNLDNIIKKYVNSILLLKKEKNIFVTWSLGALVMDYMVDELKLHNFDISNVINVDGYSKGKQKKIESKEYNNDFSLLKASAISYLHKNGLSDEFIGFDFIDFFSKISMFNSIIMDAHVVYKNNSVNYTNILSNDSVFNSNLGRNYYLSGSSHGNIIRDERTVSLIKQIISECL